MNTEIRPAATVILMREGTDTFEIFMVKRSMKSSFGSLYVFPGGTLDPEDSLPEMYQYCDGLSDDQASAKLAETKMVWRIGLHALENAMKRLVFY